MPYAELADLQDRFPRTLTAEEQDRADILLEDASFWLGVWVPGLEDAAADDQRVATAAKLLTVAMVRRTLTAPTLDDGVQSITQQAGPYQNTVAYRNPDGNLYLYARELDTLNGLIRGSQADAVSMTNPGL